MRRKSEKERGKVGKEVEVKEEEGKEAGGVEIEKEEDEKRGGGHSTGSHDWK